MRSSDEILIETVNLKKYFPVKKGIFSTLFRAESTYVHAVDEINFNIKKGEIFGLVGESGCGKTTTGRILLLLENPTSGDILFDGSDITSIGKKELKQFRRNTQIIFQDPYSSLDPRKTVYDIITEPINIHKTIDSEFEKKDKIKKILEVVDLTPSENFINKYPHELSGGQRQRVAVARALILNPKFIVADEPVSMIDVSMRIGILNLLLELREKFDISFLFITHDLAIARYICDRIAVMYLGKIVELGKTEDLINNPMHPYSIALIGSVPRLYSNKPEGIEIKGEVPTAINPPSGCRFHPRCPYAYDKCDAEEPQLNEINKDRFVACHLRADAHGQIKQFI
jgi:peptide/nickel transport system ATP-binding protein